MSNETEILDRYISTIPSAFAPATNVAINALITALANADAELNTQKKNARDQLFVKTASGTGLLRKANSKGVVKPANLGLSDEDFRELIPLLSRRPKQIRKAFYDIASLFWGEKYTHANVVTINESPYTLSVGEVLSFKVDRVQYDVQVVTSDLAVNGTATADELVAILNRIETLTAEKFTDTDALTRVRVRTNTVGPVGYIEPLTSTGIGASKVDFELAEKSIHDLVERVAIYQVNPNELIIDIPATIPLLRRTLKGSHHFHEDETLETAVAPANGIWQGGFLFNPSGSEGGFKLTSKRATIAQNISVGSVLTTLIVSDTSSWDAETGFLVFEFGTNEESFVPYRGVPNSTTLLLDPSYVFQKAHSSGTYVNVMKDGALEPNVLGTDLAVYLTSPSDARNTVTDLMSKLRAAGIILTFNIVSPEYTYIVENPYA